MILRESIPARYSVRCFLSAWLTASSILGTCGLQAASPLLPFMPRPEDFTQLWWANGPHQFQVPDGPWPEPILCLQSGAIGLVIDTQKIKLLHAGRFPKPLNVDTGFRHGDAEMLALPPVPLELSVQRDGHKFTCIGRGPLPKDSFYFPVRFIESGRFFQRIAIEGLEFADATGAPLDAKGRLEIALWPDRAVFSFSLETNGTMAGELNLRAGDLSASSPDGARHAAILKLWGPKNARPAVTATDSALQPTFDEATGCTVFKLPRKEWAKDADSYYPRPELDRMDRWQFTLSNTDGEETLAPLMFVDEFPLAITGFTPMLCDADGNPTGIPVQISKNWHQNKAKGDLPHQGPWFHGCTFVRLPPHSKREFTLAIAYARYGGVPAASHAQLSLIGWGVNQFWDQAAIGSFGESICYEPGRVQRRCSIDDVRPLMTLSTPETKPYGWAGNCGGGDFLMWIDNAGHYQGFRRTRTEYRAYGPCLTDVRYQEETARGEIASCVSVSIARSDDYLRAFYHLRYDVRQPVQWQRLAFFQLGADFYNETPGRRVAVGNAGGVREEWEPAQVKAVYDRPAAALPGDNPWLSIHGVERPAVRQGGVAATRGLIIRSWKAVLGGQRCAQPHAAFYTTEWGKGNFRVAAELAPPADLQSLRAGDFVEADLEFVVFPADPAAYYGPNEAFRKELEQHADTWGMVHREAVGNALAVTPQKSKVERNYPLTLAAARKQQAACTVAGGIGYLPVTFTGLSDYRGFELLVDGEPLNQAVHGNDFWQADYDSQSHEWRITYNLLRDGKGASRLELRKTGKVP
jgi:hypothetical protein